MAASCQNVAQTLAAVAARRPALEPVLRAFEDVLTARAALAGELSAKRADAAGIACRTGAESGPSRAGAFWRACL